MKTCLTVALRFVSNRGPLINLDRRDRTVDNRPIEQLTLREMFSDVEFVVRELTEHLEQSFRPRIRAVEEVVRADSPDRKDAPDSTVRSRMAALLGSDDFTQTLFSRLECYLKAIQEGARKAIHER